MKSGIETVAALRLTQREKAVLEFPRQQVDGTAISGKFALGNILVADGQITRAQLENALRGQASTGRRLGDELVEAGHASKVQIEGGLLLQKRLVAYALGVTVGLAPLTAYVPFAEAAQASAVLAVSATVIANARLQASHQLTQLRISPADIARGYVEAPAASRFSVATNSRSGYRIEFNPMGDFFESVQVAGLGKVVRLGADGGTIVQRGPLPPNLTHELSFRFTLRPNTLPGTYPWPLQLAVRVLV